MVENPKLKAYLQMIEHVYDIEQIIAEPVDVQRIADYYTQSERGYTLLHSLDGAVHMALSEDGKFKRKDYYAQAHFVQQYLMQTKPDTVLEIACGKGFNTLYLAQQYDAQFTGIDITPVHINIAQSKAKKQGISNVKFIRNDFHSLTFEDNQFDSAYEVESICHAIDLKLALENIYRVLKPGGYFILFDCFKKRYDNLTHHEVIATRLIEKSMSVPCFQPLIEFREVVETVGFDVLELTDISQATMPNLLHFQDMASWTLRFPLLARLLNKALPSHFTQNSIAGLLMPIASQDDILGYFRIVLQRPEHMPQDKSAK